VVENLKLYIAGEWTEGTGDEFHELRSPVTGEHIANVPLASPADIDRAVETARAATEEMRHWSAFERADMCLRIAAAIEPLVEEIARIQTLEQGKPYTPNLLMTSPKPTSTSTTPPRMPSACSVRSSPPRTGTSGCSRSCVR